MGGEALRKVRKERGWTQADLAARLGLSQTYVALLERGHRPVPAKLARKAVRALRLNPVLLPVSEERSASTAVDVARDLSQLGYPGFAYLRGGWLKNPGEVLLTALGQSTLDSRVAEALPWLLLQYWKVDADWLLTQARLRNLTNRLGFVVDLAKGVLERRSDTNSARYQALTRLSEALRSSRLAVEDTFGRELTETESNWLRKNRPREAQFWNLLTNWQPELLPYAT